MDIFDSEVGDNRLAICGYSDCDVRELESLQRKETLF